MNADGALVARLGLGLGVGSRVSFVGAGRGGNAASSSAAASEGASTIAIVVATTNSARHVARSAPSARKLARHGSCFSDRLRAEPAWAPPPCDRDVVQLPSNQRGDEEDNEIVNSYTPAFRSKMVKKLLGPGRVSQRSLWRETVVWSGPPPGTLSNWVKQATTITDVSKREKRKKQCGARVGRATVNGWSAE